MAGGLWSISSTTGSSSAALVSSGFEEEREMHNQASFVDVSWCVLDLDDTSFLLFFQSAVFIPVLFQARNLTVLAVYLPETKL